MRAVTENASRLLKAYFVCSVPLCLHLSPLPEIVHSLYRPIATMVHLACLIPGLLILCSITLAPEHSPNTHLMNTWSPETGGRKPLRGSLVVFPAA